MKSEAGSAGHRYGRWETHSLLREHSLTSFRTSIPRIGRIREKASATGPVIAPNGPGRAVWMPRRYGRFAREAYIENAIAYRCISLVAKAIASVPLWVGDESKKPLDGHPANKLLERPNPLQGMARFLNAVVGHHLISGQTYLEAVQPDGRNPPRELYVLRPDRMVVTPGEFGLPQRFTYEGDAGKKIHFDMDPVSGFGPILHMKEFHPLNEWYGLSPVEAAARAVDQFNAASAHNQSLLQNQCRPSGVFIHKLATVSGQVIPLNVDHLQAAEAQIGEKYTDPTRRGRPIVLGGEWDYKDTMLSLRDMDFFEGTQQKAREICAVWGVPHVLVVPGESTYSNRDSANLELWEQTVIPMLDMMLGDLSAWMRFLYRDSSIHIRYDIDQISALAPRRREHRTTVVAEWNAGITTLNEAREALGYDPVPDGDSPKLSGAPAIPINDPADDDSDKIPKKSDHLQIETKADDIGQIVAKAVSDEEMIRSASVSISDAVYDFGQALFDKVALGISFNIFDPAVVTFLEDFGADRIKELVGATTRRDLAKAIADGVADGETTPQLVKRIQSVFARASRDRAKMIARTEIVRASNFGNVTAMDQAGIQRKQWLSTRDSRVRDGAEASHVQLDGQTIPTGEAFTDPASGAKGMHPGGFGVAASDVNCRCAVIAVLDDGDEKRLKSDGARVIEWKAMEEGRSRYDGDLEQRLRRSFGIQMAQAVAALGQVRR